MGGFNGPMWKGREVVDVDGVFCGGFRGGKREWYGGLELRGLVPEAL